MPYIIERVPKGWYVAKKSTGERFSSNPFHTIKEAEAQRTAIILNELRRRRKTK